MSARERAVLSEAWDVGLLDTEVIPPEPTTAVEFTDRLVAAALAVGGMAARIADLAALYEEHMVDTQPVLSPPSSEHPTADAFEEEEEEIRRIAGDTAPHGQAVVAVASLLSDEEGAAFIDARLRCLPAAEYTETPKQRDLTQREGEVYDLAFVDTPAALRALREIEVRMRRVAGIYERALAIPREEHHAGCRELLRRMGVPIMLARVPYEAEGLCAAMALAGVVDFAGTEDSDVVAIGGPLLKNLTSATQPLILVDGAALTEAVPLSPEAWRDFCILLGTDASPRIYNVGPTKAFRLIKRYVRPRVR
jgi:flap endonuclease-1